MPADKSKHTLAQADQHTGTHRHKRAHRGTRVPRDKNAQAQDTRVPTGKNTRQTRTQRQTHADGRQEDDTLTRATGRHTMGDRKTVQSHIRT